jgi:hypothetical protein
LDMTGQPCFVGNGHTFEWRMPIMIKRIKEGYQVLSSKGKNLGGPYKTLDEAKKRLRQVEFFKHRKT